MTPPTIRCACDGCGYPGQIDAPFCRKHWQMVPLWIQQRIAKTPPKARLREWVKPVQGWAYTALRAIGSLHHGRGTMPVISVRQPMAAAILAGVKNVENRMYPPPGLGFLRRTPWDPSLIRPKTSLWVAIHAGKNLYDFPAVPSEVLADLAETERQPSPADYWRGVLAERWPDMPDWSDLPRGVVLGAVEIVAALAGDHPYVADDPWADPSPSNICWILRERSVLRQPLPLRGLPEVFTLDAMTSTRIRAAYKGEEPRDSPEDQLRLHLQGEGAPAAPAAEELVH